MEIVLPFHPSEELEAGDLILCGGFVLLVLKNEDEAVNWTLVNLESNEIFSNHLKHPVHVINHVKKHLSPDFKIIKSHKIKLTIGN